MIAYQTTIIETTPENVVFDRKRAIALCSAPYPGHEAGCPNVGRCGHPVVTLDRCETVLVYVCRVDLAKLRAQYGGRLNIRWWQGTAKGILRNHMLLDFEMGDLAMGCGSGFKLCREPIPSAESCGVMLLDDPTTGTVGTLSRIGVTYERDPVNVATMVAILVKRRPRNRQPSVQAVIL